ncbi:hypothetical protein BU24DRAFT_468471 [Aaosphaeria arxii CBS 175.79]|uniref:BRCT domain-containing protein n=1 Tax=Aaosphaeria arxii CBS 175.79 TaxID=1450172 RepID=A0A6A5X7R3_9PLEO|nr:uncharacterized protein BU24DRAFT_468471 [Aaosphaeria arxii CBS 175.79]KAF2009075.1 hypothetical protein BU24DRAFT_468471 [Aaosphaeria arxii CBS 175.79]
MATTDGGHGMREMPLTGVVLCCTSIPPEQRTQLAAIGAQMGATIKLDLTSDVTHLIVGSTNSAKYRYVAKSREDVKVLAPEWLEALRTIWMEGEDVDVEGMEKQYKLPAFYGLKICLTGFDDPDQRKYIQETVVHNGAEYHGDLTKSVTHLIAATPTGKKYEHAINWQMNIVTWEWFEQSCQRGMALDESFFHPTMASEDRGKGAWDRRQSPTNQLGKRARDPDEPRPVNPLRRKLRRSASSRMGTQSEALWAGITAVGLEQQKADGDDWTDPVDVASGNSLAINAPAQLDKIMLPDPALTTGPPQQLSRVNDGIFQHRSVLIHAFDSHKTNILRDHLSGNGAVVLQGPEIIPTLPNDVRRKAFLVVPHDVASDLASLPGGAGDLSLVTNWWVEQCLHKKSLVDPYESILCQPFNKLSISGFDGLIINSTGFSGIELLQVTKVVALMGASYDEYLTTKTSTIVCSSTTPNEAKLKFARSNRIQVVSAEWLWECIRTGQRQPYEPYSLVHIDAGDRQRSRRRPDPFTEVPTAPLSEEDSAKLRRKAHASKPSGKSQPQGSRSSARSLELNLSASADPTPASATEAATTTIRQDDEEPSIELYDGPASHPLQDIHPSVNSPRRPSTSSNTSNARSPSSKARSITTRNDGKAVTDPTAPQDPTSDRASAPPAAASIEEAKPDYSSIMSELLAHRKPTSNTNATTKRQPRRQLGRATSTRSNPSTADEPTSRASSVVAEERARSLHEPPEPRAAPKRQATGIAEYEPSQELGWDAPGAQEAREKMILALGGTVDEESAGVVRSIGVVRDVVAGEVVDDRQIRAGRRRRG